MVAILLLFNSTDLFYANDIKDSTSSVVDAPSDFGEPIEVKTYEEDGMMVTEKIYFVADEGSGSLGRAKSGAGWYRNEKAIHGAVEKL